MCIDKYVCVLLCTYVDVFIYVGCVYARVCTVRLVGVCKDCMYVCTYMHTHMYYWMNVGVRIGYSCM